ncbi:MAG: alkaline phosphatase D family protein [Archangium sp.]|nr:alkaline phosphatase D family protein [Archangium sp.]
MKTRSLTPTPLTRREILLALAASGCAPEARETPAADGFPCGVSSADVTTTNALVWTVYSGADPLFVEWWPASDENARQRRAVEVIDGAAQLDLTNLTAGERYVFRFTDDTRTSDTGRFRAAIADDALEPLTFAVSSCARQTTALLPLAAVGNGFTLDAFLCLGDAVYADGAITRSDYDAKWRGALARAPNRAMRRATSTIATWDDHEVENDASPDHTTPERFSIARDSFFAHQPARIDAPNRIWRSRRWGRTAEIFVLDCRGERNSAAGQYISPEQLQWLKQGIANSPATFKLVLNSVPIGNYPSALFQALAKDRWDGYPEQRRELLEFVDQHRSGVLWLTGDFHIGVAGRVALDGVGAEQVELACGPAGSNLPNPALTYPSGPQFDYASADNNVVVLDLDPSNRSVRARFVGGDGRVLFEHTYAL